MRSQKAKLAAIKAKREKQKVMKAKHRAKKEAKLEAAAVNSSADSDDEADAETKDKSADKAPPSKKRKLERKVGSGRKGTVDEEEYLLKSVTKLVARFNTTKGMSLLFPVPAQNS